MKFLWYEFNDNTKHHVFWIFFFKISIKDKIRALEAINRYLLNAVNKMNPSNMPPAEGGLRQWQLECVELLKDFDKVCKENNVKYWLDFGTLLGAVRHRGFIPWDDDIDTSMLSSDVEKIVPILKEHYKKTDYIVRTRALTCNNFQIRIRHRRYNVGIDIFPVYEYPASELTTELNTEIKNNILKARKMLDKKYRSKVLSKERTEEAIKDIVTLQNKYVIPQDKDFPANPILFHGIDFPYEEDYFIMPYNEIFPLREKEFEGSIFLVPNKAEEYLGHLWSNWEYLPESMAIRYESYFPHYKECKPTYRKDDE